MDPETFDTADVVDNLFRLVDAIPLVLLIPVDVVPLKFVLPKAPPVIEVFRLLNQPI